MSFDFSDLKQERIIKGGGGGGGGGCNLKNKKIENYQAWPECWSSGTIFKKIL